MAEGRMRGEFPILGSIRPYVQQESMMMIGSVGSGCPSTQTRYSQLSPALDCGSMIAMQLFPLGVQCRFLTQLWVVLFISTCRDVPSFAVIQ